MKEYHEATLELAVTPGMEKVYAKAIEDSYSRYWVSDPEIKPVWTGNYVDVEIATGKLIIKMVSRTKTNLEDAIKWQQEVNGAVLIHQNWRK